MLPLRTFWSLPLATNRLIQGQQCYGHSLLEVPILASFRSSHRRQQISNPAWGEKAPLLIGAAVTTLSYRYRTLADQDEMAQSSGSARCNITHSYINIDCVSDPQLSSNHRDNVCLCDERHSKLENANTLVAITGAGAYPVPRLEGIAPHVLAIG